jgi:crossover junction endodeoxyribonuclease RuvC
MRILGIDPGLRITGYGCIDALTARPVIVEAGVFRLLPQKSDQPVASVSRRLVELDTDFNALLDRTKPDCVAVEGLFSHYAHPATAIVMGHARGVLLLRVQQRGLRLVELKPAEVKKSVAGSGQADKSQVQRAIQAVFQLAELPKPPDVADALAIALTAAMRDPVSQWRTTGGGGEGASSGENQQMRRRAAGSKRALPAGLADRISDPLGQKPDTLRSLRKQATPATKRARPGR